MNELTTIQAVLYGVSGVLLYCLGVTAGKMWSDYRYQHPKQPRQKQKNKQPEGLGFDPNNPMNRNYNPYQWTVKEDTVTDEYGNTWYIRRPL